MATMIMPRLGETITEGTITKWFKNEGDLVEKDEMVLEISTDKVDTEIPAPISGTLSKILVREDNTVPVETELAIIDDGGQSREVETKRDVKISKNDKIREQAVTERSEKDWRSTSLSPLVRRLAANHNIDTDQIVGTGSGGRVRKDDILEFIARNKKLKTEPAPKKLDEGPKHIGIEDKRIPLSSMRKAIAEHMVRSRRTSAHVTTIVEVDMTKIDTYREGVKERFKKEKGYSLTFLPFVAKATIDALLKYPKMNSSIEGDSMIMKKSVNLGIAVTIADGLIVPVIRQAENLSVAGLAASISELAIKARGERLKPDDIHGGTFTITNPGGFGSIIQTPIINQPEVGILSFERIEKRVVVIDDAIAIRSMVYLPLSYDHRAVDGAQATTFLSRIKKNLEDWDPGAEISF